MTHVNISPNKLYGWRTRSLLSSMNDTLTDDHTLHLLNGESGFFHSKNCVDSDNSFNYVFDDPEVPHGISFDKRIRALRSLVDCNQLHGCNDHIALPSSNKPFEMYEPLVFGVLTNQSQPINPSPLLPKMINSPNTPHDPFLPTLRYKKPPPDPKKAHTTVYLHRRPFMSHHSLDERLNLPSKHSKTASATSQTTPKRVRVPSKNSISPRQHQPLYFASRSLDLRCVRPVNTERRKTRLLIATLGIDASRMPSCVSHRDEVHAFCRANRNKSRWKAAERIQQAWRRYKWRQCRRDCIEVAEFAARSIQIAWKHYKSHTHVYRRLLRYIQHTDKTNNTLCNCTKAASTIQSAVRGKKEFMKHQWGLGLQRIDNLLKPLLSGLRPNIEQEAAVTIQYFIRQRLELKNKVLKKISASKSLQREWRKNRSFWTGYKAGVPAPLKYNNSFLKSDLITESHFWCNSIPKNSFGSAPPWSRVAMWGSWAAWDNGMYSASEQERHFLRESPRWSIFLAFLKEIEDILMQPVLNLDNLRRSVELVWTVSSVERPVKLYRLDPPNRRDHHVLAGYIQRVRDRRGSLNVAAKTRSRALIEQATNSDEYVDEEECLGKGDSIDAVHSMTLISPSVVTFPQEMHSSTFISSMSHLTYPLSKRRRQPQQLKHLSLNYFPQDIHIPKGKNPFKSTDSCNKFGFQRRGFVQPNSSSLYGSVVSPKRLGSSKYRSTLDQKLERLVKAFEDVISVNPNDNYANACNSEDTDILLNIDDSPSYSSVEINSKSRRSLSTPMRIRTIDSPQKNHSLNIFDDKARQSTPKNDFSVNPVSPVRAHSVSQHFMRAKASHVQFDALPKLKEEVMTLCSGLYGGYGCRFFSRDGSCNSSSTQFLKKSNFINSGKIHSLHSSSPLNTTRKRSKSLPVGEMRNLKPRPLLKAEEDCLGDILDWEGNCLALAAGRKLQRWVSHRFERIVSRGNYRARILKSLGDGGVYGASLSLAEDTEKIRKLLWEKIRMKMIAWSRRSLNFQNDHDLNEAPSIDKVLFPDRTVVADEGVEQERFRELQFLENALEVQHTNDSRVPSNVVIFKERQPQRETLLPISYATPERSETLRINRFLNNDNMSSRNTQRPTSMTRVSSPSSCRSYVKWSLHNVQSPELPARPPPEKVWRRPPQIRYREKKIKRVVMKTT